MTCPLLSVAIVTFAPTKTPLAQTLDALRTACAHPDVRGAGVELILVDNGPRDQQALLASLAATHVPELALTILSGHGNVGFGRGHNLALYKSRSRYHLILNPDAFLEPNALAVGLRWLAAHPKCVMVTPRVVNGGGIYQYLCKRTPDLPTLFARGFLPPRLRSHFRPLMRRYEMRDLLGPTVTRPVDNIPLASGCCMLVPTHVAQSIGGFDPRYFLYFEDFEFSIRLRTKGSITYLPNMRIVHLGGGASTKGWAHVLMFLRSAWIFFRHHRRRAS